MSERVEYVRIDKRRARQLYDDGKTIVMSLNKPECALGDSVHFSGVTTVTKSEAGDPFDKLAADGLEWKHRYPGSQGLVWYTPKEKIVPHPKAKLITKEYEQYRKRVDPGEDFPTVIADMIADLLHLGDAMAAAATDEGEDWDPTDMVDRAMGHYTAERDGDDIELSSRESGYYS